MRFILILLTSCLTLICRAQYSKDIIIEPLLKADTNAIGQKIVYPDFRDDEVTILKVTIPPGKSTGWHKHMFPVFAYVQQGTITIDIEGRAPYQLNANSTFAEVRNTYHQGSNRGNTDVVLIAFYIGGKGEPLSIKKDPQQ